MDYVIIGNSAAGIGAVEEIRRYDKKGRITVISDEPHPKYSRPLVSYFLGKKVSRNAMFFKDANFYEENKIGAILNKKVTGIDVRNAHIILSDKRKLKFDRLLIAVGSSPVSPDIKGRNLKGVFNFTKFEDAVGIQNYIMANNVKNAIVVGGGLIGLKTTEALLALNIKTTIVELADRILSASFDKKASGMIGTALKKAGCAVVTNNTVVEIKGEKGGANKIILKTGKEIHAKLVIIAVGVRPKIGLAKETGIKTNKGITVDEYMRTSIGNIYAAGDCAEGKNLLLERNSPIAIWPVAARQGKVAGLNMTGVKTRYEGGLPMNSVELCGIPTISIGESYPEGKDYQILEYCDPEKSIYKKIVVKDNKIIGAIFIGDIERAGIYTGIIKDKINITDFKKYLLKEDFGLISLPKDYRKHLVEGKGVII